MELSLSTRVVEPAGHKDRALMGIEQFAALARDAGYSAVCMRCSQVGIDAGPETLDRAKNSLADTGLAVSMVTGDLDIPVNTDRAQMALAASSLALIWATATIRRVDKSLRMQRTADPTQTPDRRL